MGESETLISIQAETDGGGPDPFNLGGRPQRKIIAFFIEELGKSFATVASCPTTKAPNASGCAVMALVFMGFGISAYAAGARLTAG